MANTKRESASTGKHPEGLLRLDDLAKVVESGLAGVYIFDVIEQRCIYVNEECERLTGYSYTDLLAMSVEQLKNLVHPEDLLHLFQHFLQVQQLGDGEKLEIEFRIRSRQSGWTWCLSRNAVCSRDSQGRVARFMGVILNISGRKQAEADRNEIEESLRLALSAGGSGTWDWDLANNTITLSDSYRELFGVPSGASFNYESWLAAIHPEDRERCRAYGEEFFGSPEATEWNLEFRIDTPHLGLRWHRAVGRVRRGRNGKPLRFFGVSTDVTSQKEAEARLRESEERFRAMADGLPLIVWAHDADGAQDFVNLTFCEYFGVTRDEMKNGRWQLLMHPDDAEAYAQEFLACTQARRPFHAEVRVKSAGGEWRWIESWARPRFSKTGEFLGFVGTSVDITDRIRVAEEMRSAVALKDNFLSLVSHELRTPLSVILGNAQILVRGAALSWESEEQALQDLVTESERLNRLIENMLVLGRLEAGRKLSTEPVLLARKLRDVVQRFLREVPWVQLLVDELPENVIVDAVDEYIEQILQNLLSNASKYSDHGSPVELSVSINEAFAEIAVADRGIGIRDPESLFKLFRRENEGKDFVPGLGLGLAVCQRLVEAQGGSILARPREGGGSVFSFTLPLLSAVEE